MNMEKYLANQSLPSYALNFDPTQKDLIRITDPDGHPMGKYIPVPSGASVDRNGTVHFVFRAPGAHSVAVQGLGGAFLNEFLFIDKKMATGPALQKVFRQVFIIMIISSMAHACAMTSLQSATAISALSIILKFRMRTLVFIFCRTSHTALSGWIITTVP